MNLNYCTECGQTLNRINDTQYTCVNGHDYWNNPKTAVGVIIIKNNKVLMAKRGIEPQKGKYDFPGGFLDYGEHLIDAAQREMLEETGINVNKLEYIDSFAHNYSQNISTCDILFACRDWSGEPVAKDDVEALEWRDIEFAESSDFAWKYPNLTAKLNSIL